jgi:hypothetical protein
MTKTLDSWMTDVDLACGAMLGLSVYDLPDCPYADWFEDGLTAKQAARRAIRSANGDDE